MTVRPPARETNLSFSGQRARILPDGFTEAGCVLEIGGAEQSHVDPAHPEHIFYEYLRRIGSLADVMAPTGEPVTAAHLGAGGLTLPRYLQATRPGSRQVAVEIERELPSLVLGALPLPPDTRLEVLHGDARAALPRLLPALERLAADGEDGIAEADGAAGVDLVVVDIFSGRDSPAHLADAGFYAECLDLLSDRGILAINVGDDAGLAFFADQARNLAAAAEGQERSAEDRNSQDSSAVASHSGTTRPPRRTVSPIPSTVRPLRGAWTLAETSLLTDRREGNLILAAGPGLDAMASTAEEEQALVQALTAAGPHPAAVLPPQETADFARRLARGLR